MSSESQFLSEQSDVFVRGQRPGNVFRPRTVFLGATRVAQQRFGIDAILDRRIIAVAFQADPNHSVSSIALQPRIFVLLPAKHFADLSIHRPSFGD